MTFGTISTKPFESIIDLHSKTISRTPVTVTRKNVSGGELFTEGTAADILGAFYKKEDSWVQDKQGLVQSADAVLLVKNTVTVNKNDKLSLSLSGDTERYRVDEVEYRYLGTTVMYKIVRCFRIE
jgi:hypothetical protein